MIDIHTNTYPIFPIGAGIVLSSLLLGYSWARNMKIERGWIMPIINAVCFMGKYAIFIFLLYHFIIDFLDKYLLAGFYPQVKHEPLNALIYKALTLLACQIIIMILKRFTPFLLGENININKRF